MGISGNFKRRFDEANMAVAVDTHMSDDCPKFFDVVAVADGLVSIRNHDGGEVQHLGLKTDRSGQQFVTFKHSGMFEKVFKRPARSVRVEPFNGKRFPG